MSAASPSSTIDPCSSRYAREATDNAIAVFCSTSRIVTPSPPISANRSYTSSAINGANPNEGSSSSNAFGRDINARPTANICCSPPDNDHPYCRARSRNRGNSWNTRSRSAALLCPTRFQAAVATSRFSRTVSPGKIRRRSGTCASPARTRRSAAIVPNTPPSNRITPPCGRNNPEIARNNVVFPAPFDPNNATHSPVPTRSETPRNASTGP